MSLLALDGAVTDAIAALVPPVTMAVVFVLIVRAALRSTDGRRARRAGESDGPERSGRTTDRTAPRHDGQDPSSDGSGGSGAHGRS